MTLRNSLGEELHFTHYSWRRALRLAERYGWQPAGTHFEDSGQWTASGYFTRAQQLIVAENAAALASALAEALPDIPRHNAMEPLHAELGRLPDVVWFSGETRGLLRSLIRFCQLGAFRLA